MHGILLHSYDIALCQQHWVQFYTSRVGTGWKVVVTCLTNRAIGEANSNLNQIYHDKAYGKLSSTCSSNSHPRLCIGVWGASWCACAWLCFWGETLPLDMLGGSQPRMPPRSKINGVKSKMNVRGGTDNYNCLLSNGHTRQMLSQSSFVINYTVKA